MRSIVLSDKLAGLVKLAEQFQGFAPHLTAFITDSDTGAVLRPICASPVGHRWNRIPGVTLLGDAAHLMSPFAGKGADLALHAGAELPKATVADPCNIEAALAEYENALFPAAAKLPRHPPMILDGSSARARPAASSIFSVLSCGR